MNALSRPPRRFLTLLLLALVAALPLFLTSCRKKSLPPAQIHAITQEMVLAVRSATAGGVEVSARPGRPLARGQDASTPDHIYITLPAGRTGAPDPGTLAALIRALDAVGRAHGLERETRPTAAGFSRFDYRFGSLPGAQLTHSVHGVTPMASRSEPGKPAKQEHLARLAIIIDDLGYDRAAAEAVLALPFPLSVSVLPNLPHSTEVAEEAHRRGYQVILHLPMESANGGGKTEGAELRSGMNSDELSAVLSNMLESVPYASGANNHQGSQATADAALMEALMPVLRQERLFFVDSRTTAATVAYDVAQRAGLPSAYRSAPFLDDVPTPEAVRHQMGLAVHEARQKGFAITIGHPHPATLQVLSEILPQLEAHGVRLVFVSQLVR